MKPIAACAVALTLLAIPLAGAQADVEAAQDYRYPLLIEDAEGDHEGISVAPGDANPENDILSFEATDDGESLVFRINMSTLDFGAPAGRVLLVVEYVDQEGQEWSARVAYGDGGTDIGAESSPEEGMTADVDPEEGSVYFFLAHGTTGLATGDTIEFVSVSSGRTFAVEDEEDLDTVDVDGVVYTLAEAAPAGARAAPVEHLDAGDAEVLDVSLEFTEPTTMRQITNWTSAHENVTIDYAIEVASGEVTVNLTDAAKRTLLRNTFANGTTNSIAQQNATPGEWRLSLEMQDFQGRIWIVAGDPAADEDPSPAPTPTPVDDETPAAALLLLVLAVAASAVLLGRRPGGRGGTP